MLKFMKSNLLSKMMIAIAALLIMAGISQAAEIWLEAKPVVVIMPDGVNITMWGYADCGSSFTGCATAVATVPGPTLTAVAGDTLIIHLRDSLPLEGPGVYPLETASPTSVVINGQITSMTPTWTDGTTGPRVSVDQRVRSFTEEARLGVDRDYTWTDLRAGTYIYQSGTHPAVQVQMGLYGALKVDAAAGEAYTGIPYASDVVLLFSEIDTALHTAVETGTYGTAAYPSTINYVPKYFLINGKPFSASLPSVFAGTPGTSILLRFLNAGLETRVPTTEGASMTLIAEDGSPYAFAKKQYTVSLPAGNTSDVLITSDTNRYIPVYDRRLGLTNAATSPGGMLTYLGIGSVSTNTVTVSKTGTGLGTVTSVPGGIDCGVSCSGSFIADTAVTLVATPARGSSFAGWSGACSGTGDCILPMTASANVEATFNVITRVRVIAPNGGETIPAKSTYVIRWEAPAAAETFRLEYKVGKKWVLIKDGVQESVYIWTVPAIAGNKKKAPVAASMVRVTGFNSAGQSIGVDASDTNFTIEMVRLTSPNGGETLTSGSTSAIQWTTFGTLRPVTQVILQYQIKGGKKWLPITTINGSNPGSYDWLVPLVTAPQLNSKVRVTLRDATGILGQDVSDAIFTITPPPVL